MTLTRTAKARRKQAVIVQPPRPGCPNPDKSGYRNADEAIRAAIKSSLSFGRPMRIYACSCGYHHLTKRTIPIEVNKIVGSRV